MGFFSSNPRERRRRDLERLVKKCVPGIPHGFEFTDPEPFWISDGSETKMVEWHLKLKDKTLIICEEWTYKGDFGDWLCDYDVEQELYFNGADFLDRAKLIEPRLCEFFRLAREELEVVRAKDAHEEQEAKAGDQKFGEIVKRWMRC